MSPEGKRVSILEYEIGAFVRREVESLLTLVPVGGGGDLVLVAELKAVDDANDLREVASRRGGVSERKTNNAGGVDWKRLAKAPVDRGLKWWDGIFGVAVR